MKKKEYNFLTKLWRRFVEFKMPTNENALTQPNFELGICGIIQDVFQGDYTTKQNFEIFLEKN